MRRSTARLSVETSPKNRDAGGPKRSSSSSCESFIEKKKLFHRRNTNTFTSWQVVQSSRRKSPRPLVPSRRAEALPAPPPAAVCLQITAFPRIFPTSARARANARERDATSQGAERRRASALISLLLCTCLPSHWPHAHTRTHARTGSIHALNARWRLRED